MLANAIPGQNGPERPVEKMVGCRRVPNQPLWFQKYRFETTPAHRSRGDQPAQFWTDKIR
jgi:hypothetical protein